ncbi:asparaginase [Palleronia caenipelagi]|uniref:Asparaginase n=2 Tax=Palleronia caenipelagi TaxID=2489174 RepID=A0A547Q2P8_9RHOB|nr:asparaginase [Palleronia caenipelagi]
MIELWRGPFCETVHRGHAVICDGTGEVVEAWGDAGARMFPRSSCKMVQALPMVEAGIRLSPERLALASSSHEGAPMHYDMVRDWLAETGHTDDDLLCGREAPRDRDYRHQMIREGQRPEQAHNQCSGKHAGFLQFHRHLGAEGDYTDPNGPVQRQIRAAFEEVTGEDSPGYGIDGCAAPNFATSMTGLARAMARFAGAVEGADARQTAMLALREGMMAHPELVAGEGKATTLFMRAAQEPLAVKAGAEGVFVGILPGRGLGIALKITDGAPRAAEAAMAALLVRLGVLDAAAPEVTAFLNTPVMNRAGAEVGQIRATEGVF